MECIYNRIYPVFLQEHGYSCTQEDSLVDWYPLCHGRHVVLNKEDIPDATVSLLALQLAYFKLLVRGESTVGVHEGAHTTQWCLAPPPSLEKQHVLHI